MERLATPDSPWSNYSQPEVACSTLWSAALASLAALHPPLAIAMAMMDPAMMAPGSDL
jgi:hypothetical protein